MRRPMSTRQSNDGLYKRCDCARRKWLKCEHGWHFDFYKGRKFRYSLDVIARARGEQPPRAKGDAEALRDRIRGEIRSGTFIDPHAKPAPVSTDTRLTFGDVADRYRDQYVRVPTRRQRAGHAIELHLEALKRGE